MSPTTRCKHVRKDRERGGRGERIWTGTSGQPKSSVAVKALGHAY